LFVINNKGKALLFKYNSRGRTGKIKATNPMNGNGATIDPSFEIKLVSNL